MSESPKEVPSIAVSGGEIEAAPESNGPHIPLAKSSDVISMPCFSKLSCYEESIQSRLARYLKTLRAYEYSFASGRSDGSSFTLLEIAKIDIADALLSELGIPTVPEFIKPESSHPAVKYAKTPIPVELRWRVWERDDFTCRGCGSRRNLSIDHIVAEANGGPTEESNLQTLCSSCNSRKGAR
jgi:hypothetical protein